MDQKGPKEPPELNPEMDTKLTQKGQKNELGLDKNRPNKDQNWTKSEHKIDQEKLKQKFQLLISTSSSKLDSIMQRRYLGTPKTISNLNIHRQEMH